jgi:hypothetical protein
MVAMEESISKAAAMKTAGAHLSSRPKRPLFRSLLEDQQTRLGRQRQKHRAPQQGRRACASARRARAGKSDAVGGVSDVSWPRVPLGIWIALTIGWLGFSGFFVWKLWPQYDRFFQTPGNPLYGAMVRKHFTENLEGTVYRQLCCC